MPIAPLDHPILQVFARIRRIDDIRREQTAECLPAGMSVDAYEVLRLLDLRGDGLVSSQLATALHASKDTIAEALRRLAEAGWVRLESRPEGTDQQVWITAQGREAYAEALAALRPRMAKLREAFTLDEFREALPFLNALQTWFSERDWD